MHAQTQTSSSKSVYFEYKKKKLQKIYSIRKFVNTIRKLTNIKETYSIGKEENCRETPTIEEFINTIVLQENFLNTIESSLFFYSIPNNYFSY